MKQIKGFKNSWILTEEGFVKTNLIIKNGKILSIGDEIVDDLIELEENKFVIPGFIDQHIHGAAGSDVIDGTIEALYKMSCALVEEGVTGYLATTTNQSIEVIDKALEAVNEYINKNFEEGSEILGVHLEGPFICKKYMGAQLDNYILSPDLNVFKHFEEKSNNRIKLVSMAIEEDTTMELIKYLKSKDIVISVGHSAANYQDFKIGIENGVSCVTHTYNGMKPLRRDEIGTVGSSLLFDELYCEAICDGVHISSPAVKLLVKNKPKDKFILVTDALRTKYMPDGTYYELEQVIILKGKEARLDNGKLAGSVLKMNEAIKNVMDFTGCDIITAIKFATENPAKNLGLFDIMGSISENKLANFVIVDKELNVYQTIRNGKVVYNKEK